MVSKTVKLENLNQLMTCYTECGIFNNYSDVKKEVVYEFLQEMMTLVVEEQVAVVKKVLDDFKSREFNFTVEECNCNELAINFEMGELGGSLYFSYSGICKEGELEMTCEETCEESGQVILRSKNVVKQSEIKKEPKKNTMEFSKELLEAFGVKK